MVLTCPAGWNRRRRPSDHIVYHAFPPASSVIFTLCPLSANILRPLHVWIIRAATTFWHDPVDILCRILDITGLTMNTVLRIDLQSRIRAVVVGDDFIDAGRTIALLGRIVER